MEIARDKLLQMFRTMVTIREFEDGAGRLSQEARIPGVVHLYAGEEAVAVGACAHLNRDDYITSTHRGHGHVIAKGGDIRLMYAELFGRATGYCKGKGGSMHIADLDLGILGANGIVGGGAPIAVGAAFAGKYRGRGQVCLCFLGDGASNIGPVHEATNMAALYRLPLVFVYENNLYGEYTRQEREMAVVDIADRAAAYGMPGRSVDGMDVLAVYDAVGRGRGASAPGRRALARWSARPIATTTTWAPATARRSGRRRSASTGTPATPSSSSGSAWPPTASCPRRKRRPSSPRCARRSRRPSSSARRAPRRASRT